MDNSLLSLLQDEDEAIKKAKYFQRILDDLNSKVSNDCLNSYKLSLKDAQDDLLIARANIKAYFKNIMQ